jgi:hypothetical protein
MGFRNPITDVAVTGPVQVSGTIVAGNVSAVLIRNAATSWGAAITTGNIDCASCATVDIIVAFPTGIAAAPPANHTRPFKAVWLDAAGNVVIAQAFTVGIAGSFAGATTRVRIPVLGRYLSLVNLADASPTFPTNIVVTVVGYTVALPDEYHSTISASTFAGAGLPYQDSGRDSGVASVRFFGPLTAGIQYRIDLSVDAGPARLTGWLGVGGNLYVMPYHGSGLYVYEVGLPSGAWGGVDITIPWTPCSVLFQPNTDMPAGMQAIFALVTPNRPSV